MVYKQVFRPTEYLNGINMAESKNNCHSLRNVSMAISYVAEVKFYSLLILIKIMTFK